MSDHLTPIDIVHARFRCGFRGYAPAEVDAYLRRVAEEIESALEEAAHHRERAATLDRELKQFRSLEAAMRDALVLAQKAADETKTASRAQAEACIKAAEVEARAISEAANASLGELRASIENARREHRRLIRELRSRLVQQIEWLDDEDRSAVGLFDNEDGHGRRMAESVTVKQIAAPDETVESDSQAGS